MRVALLILVLVAPAFARARPLLVLVGDSTTYGTIDANYGQADVHTAAALQAMLRVVPKGHPYRRARVVNLGVPGASTRDWQVGPVAQVVCDNWGSHLTYLAAACARGVPLAEKVPTRPTAVLIVLGYADGVFGIPTEETVANVTALAARFPVSYVAVPFVPAPGDRWRPERDERRQALLDAGLVTGPDWPALPLVDGVHLSPGGYAAAAGLWLDVLP